MNDLSIMIYAIDVLSSFGSFMAFVCASTFIFTLVLAIAGAIGYSENCSDDTFNNIMRWCINCAWATAISAILLIATPNKETMYMIAASEAGQMVVETEEAREIFSDLRTIIKEKAKDVMEDN